MCNLIQEQSIYRLENIQDNVMYLIDQGGSEYQIETPNDNMINSYQVGKYYLLDYEKHLIDIQDDLEVKDILSVNNLLHYITFKDGSTCKLNSFLSATDALFLEKCLVDKSMGCEKCKALLYQGQIISYQII